MAALSGVPVTRAVVGITAQTASSLIPFYLCGVKKPCSDPYLWTFPSATMYMDQGLLAFEEGSYNISG